MRIADKWKCNCTCKVNDTKANGIKEYHACLQKFAECNKNNLQTGKKQVALIF